jgi:ElaB/YqjD/DUF883 family membrane-anchored ribosome-binding protein
MNGNETTEQRQRRFDQHEDEIVRQDVQRMKEDLAALRADFRSLAGDTFSAGRSKAASAAHSTAEHGREAIDTIGGQVRTHPLASLGVAFAGGALAGLILSHRR